MENVGLTLMMGMGNAIGEGIMGNEGLMNKFNNSKLGRWDFGGGNKTNTSSLGMTQGSFMPSQPAYVGVGANYNFNPY